MENLGNLQSVHWESDRILFGEWVREEQSQSQGQSRSWSLGNWGRLQGGGDPELRIEISVKICKVKKGCMYIA